MSKSPPITITSEELRNRAGDQAEKLARHKLDLYRQRQPGTTYYDNEYLVLLTADTVREAAFSLLTIARAM